MRKHVYDIDPAKLKGLNIYALIEGRIRYAEMWGSRIPRGDKYRCRWQILLIDKESMCEPIEDATRYLKASELFFNEEDARKELFRRKLAGIVQ